MKNTDVLKFLVNKGKEVLFLEKDNSFSNIISSMVYDLDSNNWFGVTFTDACIFKYDIGHHNMFNPVTENNEVVNRYCPIMEVIIKPDIDQVRVNFDCILPTTPFQEDDLNKRTQVSVEFLFMGDDCWKNIEDDDGIRLYVDGNLYSWNNMFDPKTDSLSIAITKDNPQYEELIKFLNYFKDNPDKQFGVFAKVNIILLK